MDFLWLYRRDEGKPNYRSSLGQPAGAPSQCACSFLGPPQATGKVSSAGCRKEPPQPTQVCTLLPPARVSWSNIPCPDLPLGQRVFQVSSAWLFSQSLSPPLPWALWEQRRLGLPLSSASGEAPTPGMFTSKYCYGWLVGCFFQLYKVELNLWKTIQTENCRGAINIIGFSFQSFFPLFILFFPNN